MTTKPERCECGGGAVCFECGRILPSYSTMSLLDRISHLENLQRQLLEAAKPFVEGFMPPPDGRERLQAAIAKVEEES